MTSPRLSDSQLVILTAAAGRDDGAVLPLPESNTLRGGARDKVLQSLVRRGLIQERPTARNGAVWRESVDGRRMALAITDAGLKAVDVDPAEDGGPAAGSTAKRKRTSRKAAHSAKRTTGERTGTKQALVLDLLQRKRGASVPEIMEATGWQAHSVRGFLSGAVKKKLGLSLVVEKATDGERRYRIAALGETAD